MTDIHPDDVRDRYDEAAWSIIVHLAAEHEPVVGDSIGSPLCALCGGEGPFLVSGPIRHRDDCAWAAARRLMADVRDADPAVATAGYRRDRGLTPPS